MRHPINSLICEDGKFTFNFWENLELGWFSKILSITNSHNSLTPPSVMYPCYFSAYYLMIVHFCQYLGQSSRYQHVVISWSRKEIIVCLPLSHVIILYFMLFYCCYLGKWPRYQFVIIQVSYQETNMVYTFCAPA